jgi:undecaprenyl-diphosphatase
MSYFVLHKSSPHFDMIRYIILAVIQGLTEFLPISSSGHMAVASGLFKVFKEPFFYVVVVHLGTTFSLVAFFFRDILALAYQKKTLYKIAIVTFISLILGFLGRDLFKSSVLSLRFVAAAFLINGVVLVLVNRRLLGAKRSKITYRDAVFLGLAQVLGMFAGISRSGITISTLILRGIKKEEAFKFSFLSAIPVIIFAFLFEFSRQGSDFAGSDIPYYIVGLFISFGVGYVALFFLSLIIKKSRLDIFGYYCILLGIVNLCLR